METPTNRELALLLGLAGSKTEAARQLGCSRPTLYRYLNQGFLSRDLGRRAADKYGLDYYALIDPPSCNDSA